MRSSSRGLALGLGLLASCATAQGGPQAETLRGAQQGERSADGDVTELRLRGLTLIVKRLPHEAVVTGQLYLMGGVRNWTASEAGVERLALATAVSGGTQSLDKQAFLTRLAALGSQLGAESDNDYSLITVKSLTRSWRATFNLMAQAFLEPALPPSEIELQRQLQLSELRQEQELPDAELSLLSQERFYAGLPYANRAIGTPETVRALTREQLQAQLLKLQSRSRLLLVVVGNVSADEISGWAERTFKDLPEGSYHEVPLAPPIFRAPSLAVADKPLPTHYVFEAFPGPSWRDPRMAVGVVAMSALREKLFEEVRTKRQLSYAPSAGLLLRGLGEGFLYVTAVDVNQTLQVMQQVVRDYQRGQIDPLALEGDKRIFLTHFLMQNESTTGQADLLARAQILGGDWRLARELPGRVEHVQVADVASFLTHYLKNLQTVVLGDGSTVNRALLQSF